MKIRLSLTLPITALALALSPIKAIADGGALDELSAQIESSSAPAVNQLTQPRQAATQTGTQRPYYEEWSKRSTPNPINTASGRINSTLDTNRFIDPITGRIDGVIEGVTGRVNGAINKTLDGLLSPVDRAIDGAFDKVDGYIDKTIASIMAPVDNAINDVMSSIDGWIENWIGDKLGGVIDEATGGLFGSIFGNGKKIESKSGLRPHLSALIYYHSNLFSS